MKGKQSVQINIQKITDSKLSEMDDMVVVEEPLEISLEYSSSNGRIKKNIAITMRTPGNDEELAAGFLFTEGIIKSNKDIKAIRKTAIDENSLLVTLEEGTMPNLANAARNFYSTSSCGICGKTSIEAIQTISAFKTVNNNFCVTAAIIYNLPLLLQKQQNIFEDTGGIHAAALFDTDGKFLLLKEDVGRHNALDKVIGTCLLKNKLPMQNNILFLSGRAGFELIQKAAMAGISMVVAIGAPSSLAVELAQENNITLIGFLRKQRFNIYAGKQRICL
ncbi:MAG TPA: formate dehydrogenase accessory sulfurtransferase FdhD [Ferruginibacter sp.]|nr:formate dehydrogenase accessory sulfurtransferase FdhD [Ferruginibacter sp.]